jgi:hypothetical protein
MSFYQFLNPSVPQNLSIEELEDLVKAKPFVNEYKILLAQKTNDPLLRDKAMAGINLLQNFADISFTSPINAGTTIDYEKQYISMTGEEQLVDWVEDNLEEVKNFESTETKSTSFNANNIDPTTVSEAYDTMNIDYNTIEGVEKTTLKADDQINDEIIEDEIKLPTSENLTEVTSSVIEVWDAKSDESANDLSSLEIKSDEKAQSEEIRYSKEQKELIETIKADSQIILETKPAILKEKKQKKAKKKVKAKDLKFVNTDIGESDDFDAWLLGLAPIEGGNIEKVNKFKKEKKKSKVEIIAEHSIEKSDEIISEGLANILVKQGHIDDAISMYRKLILNFPDKSAYFALQIEKIKIKQ